jgi:hypothetical protein
MHFLEIQSQASLMVLDLTFNHTVVVDDDLSMAYFAGENVGVLPMQHLSADEAVELAE